MCGNGMYSSSHWIVIQPRKAFLWKSLEPNSRPCSRNKKILNENEKSYLQIAQTVFGLDIYRAEAQTQNKECYN